MNNPYLVLPSLWAISGFLIIRYANEPISLCLLNMVSSHLVVVHHLALAPYFLLASNVNGTTNSKLSFLNNFTYSSGLTLNFSLIICLDIIYK